MTVVRIWSWPLSPAKARGLSTHIDLDDDTCCLDLLEATSSYFELSLERARSIIRNVAKAASARGSEISRMASAFEHTELRRALGSGPIDLIVEI